MDADAGDCEFITGGRLHQRCSFDVGLVLKKYIIDGKNESYGIIK